jgi:gamma-glutamyltranspeptidase / glutathione hydrolase
MPKASVARGSRGAVAAAHPLAVEAALDAFRRGGNAVDAAVAAQAALCVVIPHACGVGGDGFALIAVPGGEVEAVNGAGAASRNLPSGREAGASVTVPGVVAFWDTLVRAYGRHDLASALGFAQRAAAEGVPVAVSVASAASAEENIGRLRAGGAGGWDLLSRSAGDRWRQPELAEVLRRIGAEGPTAFYKGSIAAALAEAVGSHGGTIDEADLLAHETTRPAPVSTPWAVERLVVQPPMSQGLLLAMAAKWFEEHAPAAGADLDHLGAEAIGAAFEHRDRMVEGAALLEVELDVDPQAPTARSGARPYLHTAGVATADADGMTVSSLVSVFDDFGSCVFVPEGGFVMNNRADGFGAAPNDLRPGARPVHTLSPAMLLDADGTARAMSTPGADGQVQTLLQLLLAMRYDGADLASAIARPRWRSEDGTLRIEEGHRATAALQTLGYRTDVLPLGEDRFGAVVAAGTGDDGPWALGDHRREVASGGV